MTTKKKQKLRNNEYYNTQHVFDELYAKSFKDYKFTHLMELITSETNIELAFRNIKKNKGSLTAGANKTTILNVQSEFNDELVEHIRKKFKNYFPHKVKRVDIPKHDGKTRPLGIPSIEDRLIQQCIKQILEPICEAKFYKHSYGFRPNRNTHHALARCNFLAYKGFHYVVDIDIKGFFDNVDHGKLLKQLWSLGIQDKQLICIISKMLKAPILMPDGKTSKPDKGTPQGGILSPLLSNIVLNELDWWIVSQWEGYPSHSNYKRNGDKLEALKKSKMKQIFLVRYADDFKIFCKDYQTAQKIFIATKSWLKERLKLEISTEKSKIVNLKKEHSDFLGFKFKVKKKKGKFVTQSNMSNKAKKAAIENIKDSVREFKKNKDANEVIKFNSKILGLHNYYKVATNVSVDFKDIAYLVKRTLYNSTKDMRSKDGHISKTFIKYYGKYKYKIIYLNKVALFPINGISYKTAMNFQQDICNYTEIGRQKIHNTVKDINMYILQYLMGNPIKSQTVEYNDNRISLYVGQKGKCYVTGINLEIGFMDAHHKIPKSQEGTDAYDNLVFINSFIHKIIHATNIETVKKYSKKFVLGDKELKRINKLRKLVGNKELIGIDL